MITEDEAFWAGIAVATMIIGGGFSMLFLRNFTGYGAVVLAMGLLTMAVTIQMRAKPSEHVEIYTPTPSREITPTPPIENTNETEKLPEQPRATETKTEQPTSEPAQEQPKEQPKEPAPQTETPQTQPPAAEPVAPPQPQEPAPQSPEPPPQTVEPPRIEEKPKEEPQVTPPAN